MAVYVDNYGAAFGRMVMCHMIADSRDELLAMVDRIGVQRKWIQKAGTFYEHFDICLSKREKAVKAGAIELRLGEFGRLLMAKRASAPIIEEVTRVVFGRSVLFDRLTEGKG